ncbi:MAG: hypothetical protein IJM85_06450 [Clostridia bacterium]|nr:hypothetical protein [Clostridia bacterium]
MIEINYVKLSADSQGERAEKIVLTDDAVLEDLVDAIMSGEGVSPIPTDEAGKRWTIDSDIGMLAGIHITEHGNWSAVYPELSPNLPLKESGMTSATAAEQ